MGKRALSDIETIELNGKVKRWTKGECKTFDELLESAVILNDPAKLYYTAWILWDGDGNVPDARQKSINFWIEAIERNLEEWAIDKIYHKLSNWAWDMYVGGSWNKTCSEGLASVADAIKEKYGVEPVIYLRFQLLSVLFKNNCVYDNVKEQINLLFAKTLFSKLHNSFEELTEDCEAEEIFNWFYNFHKYNDTKKKFIFLVFDDLKKSINETDFKEERKKELNDKLEHIVQWFNKKIKEVEIINDTLNTERTAVHECAHFVIQNIENKENNVITDIIVLNKNGNNGRCMVEEKLFEKVSQSKKW